MTIKETAGKVLLYFYQLQRTAPLGMRHRQLGFVEKKTGEMYLTCDKQWLKNDLSKINAVSSDVFNAFTFLLDKGLIQSAERATAGARVYMGVQLTSRGIDLVEGVESGYDGRRAFTASFNIKVDEATSAKQLIKDNLDILAD